MLRLVLTTLAAILAGSVAQAQRSGGGSTGCPSGGGTASLAANNGSGSAFARSAALGGGTVNGVNPSNGYGTTGVSVASTGYGYNVAQMGTGAGSNANFAALNGLPGGFNNQAGGYNASSWGNPTGQGGFASAGLNNGAGAGTMNGLAAYQGGTNGWNPSGDDPFIRAMTAARARKSSSDAATRSGVKAKKSLAKARSKTTKTKTS